MHTYAFTDIATRVDTHFYTQEKNIQTHTDRCTELLKHTDVFIGFAKKL